jgi:hypothetical protein
MASSIDVIYASPFSLGWEIRSEFREFRRNSEFRSLFLAELPVLVSDSDRKVGSRHFFNITEPIPAINVPIFSGGILFPPFFPQGEENAQKGHLLSTDPPKGHLLVFEKKKQNAESVLSSGSAGEGGRLTATTRRHDDDNDNDDDDDDNDGDGDGDGDGDDDSDGDRDGDGDGDGRAPRGQWGAAAAAGAADRASSSRHRGFPARACTYSRFFT